MKTLKDQQYAVITGDIVRSSALTPPERRRLLKVIDAGSRQIRRIVFGLTPTALARRRVLQWVAPSGGVRVVARTRSRISRP